MAPMPRAIGRYESMELASMTAGSGSTGGGASSTRPSGAGGPGDRAALLAIVVLTGGSQQPGAQREGDRVRPVSQVQAAQHAVDDVLDRALRVAEALCDLLRVQPFGQQPEHVGLARFQPGGGEPVRRE